MLYTVQKKLLPIEEIVKSHPLSQQAKQKIQQDRQEIRRILEGTDRRLLIVVGPCSAWPKPAVLCYAQKLLALEPFIKHTLKIVMRVYIQKPRTLTGWMGPLNQPDLFAPPDILEGINYSREMMVNIVEMGLPIADEALFTQNHAGFLELLSWVTIGARSSEDPVHRIFASAIDCPVGLKNPTHGSLSTGVNSVAAAQHSHVTLFHQDEVKTHGNLHAHLVLRGSLEGPNYSLSHLQEVDRLMTTHQIKNPSIIIDASHDNCFFNGKKNYNLQPNIIFNILKNLKAHSNLTKLVKGFMLESFLKAGKQSIGQEIDLNGLSITDPCLGWDQTEEFLLSLAQQNPLS